MESSARSYQITITNIFVSLHIFMIHEQGRMLKSFKFSLIAWVSCLMYIFIQYLKLFINFILADTYSIFKT